MSDFFSELMKSVDSLTEEQMLQLLSALEVKKAGTSKGKTDEKVENIPMACTGCGSIAIIKKGMTKTGNQIYKCKDCNKKFSSNTGTALFRTKLSASQWKGLLLGIVQNLTAKQIAEMIDCTEKTVLNNKHKLCELLRQEFGEQDNLSTIIECDEKYAPLSFKGKRDPKFFVYTLGRLPRHHRTRQEKIEYLMTNGLWQELQGDQVKLEELLASSNVHKRGISNEQVCIVTCRDRNGGTFIRPICIGRPESEDIAKALNDRIPYDAVLVTDSHNAYISFVEKEHIHHEQIPPGKHTKGAYNLAQVNAMHSKIENMFFINPARSPATKYLDLYLMLFYWLEKNKALTDSDKVTKLLEIATDDIDEPINQVDLTKRPLDFNTKGLIPTKV
ncbi:IS1595 family transposase [Bengtsoniella intestinalis]|uniref:IS1595 family transposase n=1 Tax=Bengtsoniella intestinalis TaxID=3073143 RepID=UPI00391EFC96